MLLHHHFIDVAKRVGDKLAIHDFTTNKEVTYSRALLASLLLSSVFRSYDRGFIGVMLPTSAGCILTKIALLMSGRTPVMINYSTGADQNAAFAQRKCDFRTIITSRALLEKIDCPFVEGMIYIEDIMEQLSGFQKVKAALLSKLPAAVIKKLIRGGSDEDTAVILFTSGSEKDPKAVQLTHRNINANVQSASKRFNFNGTDTFLSSLPYFHVFGLTVNLWIPLHHGDTILTYANPLEYKKICEIVRDHKATLMVGTPSFFWGYLKKSEKGDFKSLRIALVGADKCSDSLREAYQEKHEQTLYEGYGATECAPVISANSPDDNRPGSVGKPIPDVQVRIENYETGEECGPGEDGRILVKGNNVMKGYFDDFEQTSLHIRNGWYDTGDMGNIDEDGYLWHVGRIKRFVKIGGEMVSLVKIESVLDGLLPDDAHCCVVEIPDSTKGARIVAVITEKINEKTILKQMAEQLPKNCPAKAVYPFRRVTENGQRKNRFSDDYRNGQGTACGKTQQLKIYFMPADSPPSYSRANFSFFAVAAV
jgi:acyl-[acyl-carrier-protein]-phospholipid O-acyltransferase/long-chain-fatty-acid--[acyl-carrier-protein] ligase